jgi:hypothetical protein
MKKVLFPFVILAITTIAILEGCTKPKTCDINASTQVGGYTGQHSILGGLKFFDDSLTASSPIPSDNSKISVKSERLGVPITGTFDPNNCGRVILDSISIPSATISSVVLTDVRAGGYGICNGNTLNTVINIKSGNASIDGTPISLSGQALTGVFTLHK